MPRPALSRRALAVLSQASLLALAAFLGLAQARPTEGKKYALLVGVTEYEHPRLGKLRYPENDVEELAALLGRPSAGFAEVRVLTVARGKRDARDMPTAANIRSALDRLLDRAKGGDTVLFAFAGHGVQLEVEDPEGKRPSRSHPFICPSDADFRNVSYSTGRAPRLVNVNALMADLGNSRAGTKLVLLDACRNDQRADSAARNVDVNRVTVPDGVGVLFSCKSGERAFETAKLGKGHGVFFWHVLKGLEGAAASKGGAVTWARLLAYVTEEVEEQTPLVIGGGARQTPHGITNIAGSTVLARLDLAGGAARGTGPDKEAESSARKEPAGGGWGREVTNSIGMKLARIPKGTFTMGSPPGEKYREQFEKGNERQHEVEITKDFWLGAHEVTQRQFGAVMGYNPSYFSSDGKGDGGKYAYGRPGGGKEKVPGLSTDDFPVENVSWLEARAFCAKLSDRPEEKRAGREYRLPTEAEWEYACRAGTTTPFHLGDSLSSEQANFAGDSPYGSAGKGPDLGRTAPVGHYKKPNAWGLFDMHGNVQEWCSDVYQRDYHKDKKQDPQGPPPAPGSLRVARGGFWSGFGWWCRSAVRGGSYPGYRSPFQGFRVALAPAR